MLRLAAFALTALFILPAAAQVPAPPATAQYRERDAAARIFFEKLDRPAWAARMNAYVERHPDEARAWVGRAYWNALQGNAAQAQADLARAHALPPRSKIDARHVDWSEGWTRLSLGDVPGATAAFQAALHSHGGRPAWAPPALALLAQAAGDRDTAVAWYGIAARDYPDQFGRRGALVLHTRYWQAPEREAILAVFEDWSARRAAIAAAD